MCDTPEGSSPPPRIPSTIENHSVPTAPPEHPNGVWSGLGPSELAQEDLVSEIWEECDACCSDDPAHALTGKLCTRHRQERLRMIRAAANQGAAESTMPIRLTTPK